MECNSITLKGIVRDCNPNMGGIQKVWMILKSDITKVTVGVDSSSDVDMITELTVAEGTGKVNAFEFRKGAASMTSNLQKDDTNGSYFWLTDLVMNFQRMETSKRAAIMALTLAEACAIVQDANGIYWFLGLDEYLGATAGTAETGTAKTDANKYSITLQDSSLELPYEIEKTVAEAVVAKAKPKPVTPGGGA